MSAFRPIQPSGDEGGPLGSAKDLARSSGDTANPTGERTRKRRAPSHVSLNACTNCKKARAKCDGEEPNPCTRCTSRGMADVCLYEVNIKTAKDAMAQEITSLRGLTAALQNNLKEKDDTIQQLQGQIMMGSPHGDARRPSAQSSENGRGLSDMLLAQKLTTPPSEDESTTEHLLKLYFTWVHPTHMLFSEYHFKKSRAHRDNLYCTNTLVQAITAIGCFYPDDDGSNEDLHAIGQAKIDYVRIHAAEEDAKSVTFCITYAMLFLAELCAGQARKASSHLRLAVESLPQVEKDRCPEEAWQVAFWGLHTLNTVWGALTYSKPAAPSTHHGTVPSINLDHDQSPWRLYRFRNEDDYEELPGHTLQCAREQAKLNQFIHGILNLYCGTRGRVTAQSVCDIYDQLITWRHDLGPDMRLDKEDKLLLPHVLVLHITYYIALAELFQPLLSHPSFSKDLQTRLRNVAAAAARDGFFVLARYKRRFGSRYQPPQLPYCLVHMASVLLRSDIQQVDGWNVLRFVLESLSEHQSSSTPRDSIGSSPESNASGFGFVEPLKAMFINELRSLNLPVPPGSEQYLEIGDVGAEDMLDACERTTFVQPVELLKDRFEKNIGHEEGWSRLEKIQSSRSIDIKALMNP